MNFIHYTRTLYLYFKFATQIWGCQASTNKHSFYVHAKVA